MAAKFCKRCGQKLPSDMISFFSVNKSYEFEDGDYCERCAKQRVEEKRQ